MTTLHIEHPITDFDTRCSAFDRFADARAEAGVRARRIGGPVDDPRYVVIDLDFDTAAETRAFLGFLLPGHGDRTTIEAEMCGLSWVP